LTNILDPNWQIYAVAILAGLAMVAFALRKRRRVAEVRSGDGDLLSMVLNNMTQGVVLFDAHEKVLVCNDRYVEMTVCRPAS
jgi:PAS domain-containing protein